MCHQFRRFVPKLLKQLDDVRQRHSKAVLCLEQQPMHGAAPDPAMSVLVLWSAITTATAAFAPPDFPRWYPRVLPWLAPQSYCIFKRPSGQVQKACSTTDSCCWMAVSVDCPILFRGDLALIIQALAVFILEHHNAFYLALIASGLGHKNLFISAEWNLRAPIHVEQTCSN